MQPLEPRDRALASDEREHLEQTWAGRASGDRHALLSEHAADRLDPEFPCTHWSMNEGSRNRYDSSVTDIQ